MGWEGKYVANECIHVLAISVYNSSLQSANEACKLVWVQGINFPDQKHPLIMGRELTACMQYI